MTIKQISDKIQQVINAARPPQTTLPAILLACSAINRPGLSAMEIVANIISKQGKCGIEAGPMPGGYVNEFNLMVKLITEEIVDAIKLKSQVQASTPIGGMQVTAFGANAGGPIVVNGINITASNAFGVTK